MKRISFLVTLVTLSVLFVACGSSEYPTIGGKVEGLVGTLVLQNNKAEKLVIKKNGSFTFEDSVAFYGSYEVAITDKPANQTCFITRNSGSVTNKDINNVTIKCYTDMLTFTPLTATTVSVASNSTATVQYVITNKSVRALNLGVFPVTAIAQLTTPGLCGNPIVLGIEQSCVLSLRIAGGELTGVISDGPKVCQHKEVLCFEPNHDDLLNITPI